MITKEEFSNLSYSEMIRYAMREDANWRQCYVWVRELNLLKPSVEEFKNLTSSQRRQACEMFMPIEARLLEMPLEQAKDIYRHWRKLRYVTNLPSNRVIIANNHRVNYVKNPSRNYAKRYAKMRNKFYSCFYRVDEKTIDRTYRLLQIEDMGADFYENLDREYPYVKPKDFNPPACFDRPCVGFERVPEFIGKGIAYLSVAAIATIAVPATLGIDYHALQNDVLCRLDPLCSVYEY